MYAVQHPEKARELLLQRPSASSFVDIAKYYEAFISLSEHEDQRRVFIACMLHIFLPNAFTQPSSVFKPQTGFSKHLLQCLNMDAGRISKTIDEVRIRYKVDDQFKAEVDEALVKLKGGESDKK